jgi:hypothetical protein
MWRFGSGNACSESQNLLKSSGSYLDGLQIHPELPELISTGYKTIFNRRDSSRQVTKPTSAAGIRLDRLQSQLQPPGFVSTGYKANFSRRDSSRQVTKPTSATGIRLDRLQSQL